MTGKAFVEELLEGYDLDRLSIATIASHSALQILHGAKKEGLRTVLILTPDRAAFYDGFKHLIDEKILVNRWSDLCRGEVVERLRRESAIIFPHGSFVEYTGIDCVERIRIPIFGLRSLYRWEADQRRKMELLASAGIPTPRIYRVGEELRGPAIVKLPGAKGGRGYFIETSMERIVERLEGLVKTGLIRSADEAIIQEYIVGVTAYYHYFFSPILNRLEIMGADIRYESDIDGVRRLPPSLAEDLEPTFTVVGNIPLVLRESLLPTILEYGVMFVKRTQELLPPGIIGPFCLESVIDRDMRIKVFEFSGRIVAGTNLYINGSPYSYLYWDEPMSTGRRVAREIRMALEKGLLATVLT